MNPEHPVTTDTLTLDSVKQQFTNWRSTRTSRERIPDSLWQAAINIVLEGEISLHKIAKELRLNYSDLKAHVQKKSSRPMKTIPEPSSAFIEIEPAHLSDCVIEMEDRSGTKMRLCFRGKADPMLVDLGRFFLMERA